MRVPADWLRPEWQAAGVDALMTTRNGGVSGAPFDSCNLRPGIGDDPAAVAENQRRLAEVFAATPVYLNQVHGAKVVRLTASDLRPGAPLHDADGSVTTESGLACAVQVADCLPVLFAAPDGRAVGAAHAGWRGLAAGVLEETLAQVCTLADCVPGAVQVWLGACIGPTRFEVGPDVLEAFDAPPQPEVSARFLPGAPGKWLADLPGLARDRLEASGVRAISGGGWCTASSPEQFFSYRRDRITGRMAALIRINAAESTPHHSPP